MNQMHRYVHLGGVIEHVQCAVGAEQVRAARADGEMTVPSLLADELAANPFMRTRQQTVIDAARNIDPDAQAGASTMAVIRAWKDRF